MKRLVLVALMAAALAVTPKAAQAAIVIDFGTGNAGVGGTFTLLGGNHASGTGIPVASLAVDLNGVLSSYTTSGAYNYTVNFGPPTGVVAFTSAVLNFNTQTNSIQIVGGVPGLGIPNGTVLLTGTFFSWVADSSGLHNAIGPDTKNATLLTALGLPTNTPFAFFGFSLTSSRIGTEGSQWSIVSTDIRNTAVPEPGSMILLGTGLLGCATLARRRMKKA